MRSILLGFVFVVASTSVFSKDSRCLTIFNDTDIAVDYFVQDKNGQLVEGNFNDPHKIETKFKLDSGKKSVLHESTSAIQKGARIGFDFGRAPTAGYRGDSLLFFYEFGMGHRTGAKSICGKTLVLQGKGTFFYLFEPSIATEY